MRCIVRMLQVCLVVFPWSLRRLILNIFFKARIDRSARVGFSVIITEHLELGKGVRIGHFNLIKGLSLLRLDESASIGHLNWISGYPSCKSERFTCVDRIPSLLMGRHSALTQFHRFDCSDTINIGEFSIVAGYGTQVLTHSVNLETAHQEIRPVRIDAYTFVGSRSVILPGSVLPRCSVLGAGSVLLRAYHEEYYLYGGVPAKPIKSLGRDWAYFNRHCGYID